MKKQTLFFLGFIFTILFSSCSDNDIFKTNTDEYASRNGNFVAKFPKEPNFSVIKNKIGLDEFDVNLYMCSLTPKKIFTVEYTDYNNGELSNYSNEEIYKQAINNTLFKLQNIFKVEYQEDINQHNLKGKYYILEFKDKNRRNEGYITMKMFIVQNRFYKIMYTGINEKSTDDFMKSFRLLKN